MFPALNFRLGKNSMSSESKWNFDQSKSFNLSDAQMYNSFLIVMNKGNRNELLLSTKNTLCEIAGIF